ncbi:hypothetical protein FACS1894172_17680 [Spirochaetia bacterium]|nr:hypothetical protein FACS1894164_11240 [Spirochaetia bacterium]GHU35629.1 hypothetical protein FACS1894172_17680 [Spirochaetia bacterium]
MAEQKKEPSLTVQTKPVDARWSIQGLSKNVTTVMDKNPSDGNIYAFINKWFTIVLLLQYTEKGPVVLKKKLDDKTEWPSSTPLSKDTTITLNGLDKNKFLEDKGCPKNLSP